MAAPVPGRRAARESAVVPCALVLAALAVWLSLPDKTYVFDGVMFAQFVERSADEWRRELLNPRHLLFNPFFQLLRDGLGRAGLTVGAYRLFQTVNAFAGAAGLLLFGDTARRLSRDDGLGWCAALLLGATWGYGTRATEGQVYMLMSLGAIAFLWAVVRLLEEPGAGRAAATVGAAVLGALFHAADAFLFPAVALALRLAFPKRRSAVLAGAAAASVLLVVPYLLVFGQAGLRGFLGTATDFHAVSGGGFWTGLFAAFWNGGGMSPPERLAMVWRETGGSLTPLPSGAALAAGLGLWIAAGGALLRSWPRLDLVRRAQAAVIGAAWAGFVVVNSFWRGGLFFYVPAHACALGLLALSAGPFWADLAARSRRRALQVLALLGVGAAAWNVRAGLLPQSRLENNPGYRRALFVGAHTEPSSWVVISGFGFANSKVYIPMFADRPRAVLESFLAVDPKDVALGKLAWFARDAAAHGLPMYLLSDIVERPGAAPQLLKSFGVTMGEINGALGAGRAVCLASSPEERVYLYVPRDHQAELFAVLGYAMLTEEDPTRLGETSAGMADVARGMSPAERRRAGDLLRTKDWGLTLLLDGFASRMSAESAAAAKVRAERFAEYRKTPTFWLRAGNLYRMLGLKAETLDAWTRAQRMSGNADLLRRIEELRRSKEARAP